MKNIPEETLNAFDGDEFRARIFYEKYALEDKEGNVLEKTPDEMWRRVARELASVEAPEKRKTWEENFYWMLKDFKFVPGGRILFAAGEPRKSTLLNCYYIPLKEDSIEGIFDAAKEMARTYSYGGGVGIDVSILRPSGSPVNNSAMTTSGPVPFMDLYSTTTGVIGQHGRRGALMITMDVSHPDIFDFVVVKRDKTKVNFANISVKVTDDFMKAVENDGEFELKYHSSKANVSRKIRAKDLWNKMIDTALETGDPGIIFWDAVKREAPLEYDERMQVHGTNPCAEQPLEDYGACDLGSINLTKFVDDEFTEHAKINWNNLEKAIRYAVRFLDNVIDYSYPRHPLKAQAEETKYARRIGLGLMGLADMLIQLGLKYDSEEAINLVDSLAERIKEIAYDESVELAIEKGPFPGLNVDKHLQRDFVKRLSDKLKEKIKKHGLRNGCLLTIPPTGSTASLAGVSSGIEPIYALSYKRRSESLSKGEFDVLDPFVKYYMDKKNVKSKDELPPIFVTAHKIDPFFRVKMQAVLQKHIDSSISSTVNLAPDTTRDVVDKIYMEAWRQGCKSITVYREGSKYDILKANDEETSATPPVQDESKLGQRVERESVLSGVTIKFPMMEGGLYVTINKSGDKIKEVFISMGRSGDTDKSYTEALGRLISIYLQSGGDVDEVIHTLKGIKGGESTWFNGVRIVSIPDAVAKALEIAKSGQDISQIKSLRDVINHDNEIEGAMVCPQCGNKTLIFENGCYICKTCGYTKCE